MNKLTQKRENFCLNLIKGLSQREAYVKAGYSSNQLPATLDKSAYDLALIPNIITRLEELRANLTSKAVMPLTERQERLTEFAREDIETKEGNLIRHGNISAIAELNKIDHIYEAGGNVRDVNVIFVVGKGYVDSIEGKVIDGHSYVKMSAVKL